MPQKYGWKANEEVIRNNRPCLVCDDAEPTYSWTDYSGEGYCLRCGTPYQLKWGELKEGETYPRINIIKQWISLFRRFYKDTGKPNGTGTFLLFDCYPDQLEGRRAF